MVTSENILSSQDGRNKDIRKQGSPLRLPTDNLSHVRKAYKKDFRRFIPLPFPNNTPIP